VKNYLTSFRGIPFSKVSVVRAGIDTSAFGKSSPSGDLRPNKGAEYYMTVGTVGRITSIKGTDLFLQLAASLVQKTEIPLKFLIVASTADREYYRIFQTLVDELRLRNHIILVEDVEDVVPYYSLMDIFVSTAREDPFPLVILEAMASHLPVVAFSVGGIPEAVTAESALLVDDLNVASMVAGILRLIKDPDQRKAMGKAGRRHVEREFDISKNIEKIQNIINSALTVATP